MSLLPNIKSIFKESLGLVSQQPIQTGLGEELSTDPAPVGTPNAPPSPNTPTAQGQGKDPTQIDPKVYQKYKAEADNLDKKIDNFTKQIQTLRQSKADLSKKYGINPTP